MAGNKNSGFASNPNNINKNGRPKLDQSLSKIMRNYLEVEDSSTKVQRKQQFVELVYKMAIEGNFSAIKLIWAYVDGLPIQRTEVEDKEPLNIIVSSEGYHNPKAKTSQNFGV